MRLNYCDGLVELGSVSGVREPGRLRVEGRDYELQDGDIVLFRFDMMGSL